MAEDKEVMAVWGVRILYALAGFLVYFTFTNLFTTGESTKTTTYRLESRIDVLKNEIDGLKARDIELTAKIADVAQGQQAGIPRFERMEITTQTLGLRINERTDELGRKIDGLVGKVEAIDTFLRTGSASRGSAPR